MNIVLSSEEKSKLEPKDDEKKEEENMDIEDHSSEEKSKLEPTEADETTNEGDKLNNGKGTKRKLDNESAEVTENEPDIPDHLVCLDWYNSDLNLRINEEFMSAAPFIPGDKTKIFCWPYCYAGARATFGFSKGTVWFEVKYTETMEVKPNEVDKTPTIVDLRVGWSLNSSSLMLGENSESWCYSSAEGKLAHNSVFEEYGEKFSKGDIIGAYVDFEGDKVCMTFTKNA